MSKSRGPKAPPSSRTTTLAPRSASRAATTAPPAPEPMTQTSGRSSASARTSWPEVIPPRSATASSRATRRWRHVRSRWSPPRRRRTDGGRAGVPDRPPGGRRGVVRGADEPPERSEAGPADVQAARLPGAEPRVLSFGRRGAEADGRSVERKPHEGGVEEDEEPLRVPLHPRVAHREERVDALRHADRLGRGEGGPGGEDPARGSQEDGRLER